MTESLFLRIHLVLFIVPGDARTDRHSRLIEVTGSQRTLILFTLGFQQKGKDPHSACVSLQGVSPLEHRTNIETVSEHGARTNLCHALNLILPTTLFWSSLTRVNARD